MKREFKVGDKAPVIKAKLTRTDFVKYAGASGDFNPMHHDEIIAKSTGNPSVFGHGMYSMGLLSRALVEYVGLENIKEFSVRFTQQAWPGEELYSEIEVAEVVESQDGISLRLNLSLKSSASEKAKGFATAYLKKA